MIHPQAPLLEGLADGMPWRVHTCDAEAGKGNWIRSILTWPGCFRGLGPRLAGFGRLAGRIADAHGALLARRLRGRHLAQQPLSQLSQLAHAVVLHLGCHLLGSFFLHLANHLCPAKYNMVNA
jgi:hypothetical protein